MDRTTTITRRAALRTGTLATLVAGLLGMAGTPASAAGGSQPSAIERAEAAMHDVEAILVHELDELARVDVMIEMDRLTDIAKSNDPRAFAAEVPRNTGDNRLSIVDPYPWDDES